MNPKYARPVAIAAVMTCAIATSISAQQITINYSKIVNATPITHSGMTIEGVIEHIKKAQSSQMSSAELARRQADVNKWKLEAKNRKQKAEATRARLNEMLAQQTISLSEAKAKYEEWVRYTAEAQSEFRVAQTVLTVLTQQNQVIQNLQSQVEPFLEPYAFLLEDALETVSPEKRKDLIDVGDLFPAGQPQPAWADLVRTRRFFVLSDGRSYARIFAPAATSQEAYSKNYSVLRHVLGWLWDSTKTQWDVDVYAYQNDLINQVLKLDTTAYAVKVNSIPPPATNTTPIDLQSISDFLRSRNTLEGAYLNDEGTLVLYGSKGTSEPQLDNEPIELADLAVAYRAVYYAGHGDAYISLDPSPYPEQVNVNFGGRLADTRMGWVVLRSDMRFKTLSDGFDAASGEDRTAAIRKLLPDFKTQAERELQGPRADTIAEYTRYWFSPDGQKLIIATNADKKFMKITSPRFTGNAVREDPALGNIVGSAQETPAATRNTLDHLNRNYNAFAGMFPELRELDEVGRFLALFTWLKERNTNLDLDSLLAVTLPECRTPRQKPQMLVGYSIDNRQITPTNASDLADGWASTRPRKSNGAAGGLELPADKEDLQEKITVAVARNQSSAEARLDFLRKVLSNKIDVVTVIAGGIDLNLRQAIVKSRRIPPAEMAVFQRLKQSPVGEIRVSPRRTIARARVNPVISIQQPRVSGLKHALGDAKPNSNFGSSAKTRSVAGTEQEITSMGRSGEELNWSRRGTRNSLSDEGSRLVYYKENNVPVAFVRYDNGTAFSYKLSAANRTFVAEKTASSKLAEEVASVNRALRRGESTVEVWRALPENTNILGFEKLSSNESMILRKEGDILRFARYNRQGVEVESLQGDLALNKFNGITREQIAAGSTNEVEFVHGSTDGRNFTLQVGNKTKEVPLSDIKDLMENPTRLERSPLDELFAAPAAGERNFIVYRDGLSRRPNRFGGAYTEGTVSDPTQILSLVRQRYRGRRVFLDDEIETAKKNLASLRPITRAGEIGLIVPEKSFDVRDFNLARRIKGNLAASGLVVIESPQQLKTLPNVLVVAGHNDANLLNLLTSLGEQGLLRDKVLLLNTCYDKGNPNLFHDLIHKYQPKAVFLHTDKISDVALDPVLKNLGELVGGLEQTGESIHPGDLFERAVDRTLKNPNLSDRQRIEINKLLKSSLQISYVKTLSRRSPG